MLQRVDVFLTVAHIGVGVEELRRCVAFFKPEQPGFLLHH
jgi:hypothetical protein